MFTVLGKVIAVHVFNVAVTSEDISKLDWLRRADAAHITGPPKHHRGTSSKGAPEAKGHDGSKVIKGSSETYLGCSTEEKGKLDSYAQADSSPYTSWILEETGK